MLKGNVPKMTDPKHTFNSVSWLVMEFQAWWSKISWIFDQNINIRIKLKLLSPNAKTTKRAQLQ